MEGKKLDLKDVREKSRPILDKHGVQKAEVFGSYARGEQDKESDIDLLVEMENGATLIDIAELKKELENILEVQVDVLTYNSIHPEILSQVQDEAVEI